LELWEIGIDFGVANNLRGLISVLLDGIEWLEWGHGGQHIIARINTSYRSVQLTLG
jgi:hypothetical protein